VASASRDIRIAAVGLFIAFPVLLWGCAVFGVFYVGVLRYYSPLMPLALFAAYIFACGGLKQENKIQGVLRMASAGYLSGYICMAVYGIALLVLPGERGSGRRVNFVGTRELHQWPSMKVTYEFSPAREYVLALLKEQPDTVLVTNRENWFYADPGVDRSRLHRILRLRASYVSGPAHILIVATDPRGDVPEEALYFFLEDGKPRRLDYFEGRLDLHMLKRFPAESVKILETWIPEGTTITLNKPAK
jgi:hypothetical protein